MRTANTVIFLLAIALASAQADIFNGRSRDRQERPRTSIKDGVKNLAKGIWSGVRYQKAAIEDTLRDVKDDLTGNNSERRPAPQPEPRYEERRPAYNPGPYRRPDHQDLQEGGDFLNPEPLWKEHERDLERRRRDEAAAGYEDRQGEPLPPPRELPQYDPRQKPQNDVYGPVGPAVRTPVPNSDRRPATEKPTSLPGPNPRQQSMPEFEEAEVQPLTPDNKETAKVKEPTPKNEPKKTTTPPKQQPKVTDFKKATKTDKEGIVLSPYPPYDLLDITGLKSGSLAKDPKTGQIFRVP